MTETIEDVCTETAGIVGVLLICDVLNKHRGVEVNERTIDTSCAIGIEVDWSERPVGTVTLAHHCHSAPSTRVGIEPIGLLTCCLVLHFHEVGSEHGVPLTINVMTEHGSLVAPVGEVLNWCRPYTDVITAILCKFYIMRANDIGTQLAGIIGILEHARLSIWQMLPKREIGVLGCSQSSNHRQGCNNQFFLHRTLIF